MTFQLAYNPSDGPVVIDSAGRTLGSREWGPVDLSDDAVRAPMSGNRLVTVDAPGEGADPAALEAARETERLNKRASALHASSKPALTEAARAAGLVGAEDTPAVADLVGLLVRTDVPIPTTKSAGAPATKES